MDVFGVIMAGGGGTRFWPLSRQLKPKQMLNLTGGDMMINETIDRMSLTVRRENIRIVTNAKQSDAMRKVVTERVLPENMLVEPVARNTAACIGYAAIDILKRHGDGVMLITPSDHYISDAHALSETFQTAIKAAEEEDKLVTIGLKPLFASTGYGYIRYNDDVQGDAKPVLEFREKPDEQTARSYVESGEYAWNSGMFIWKVSTILDCFRMKLPDIYEGLSQIGDAIGSPNEREVINTVYPQLRKISIDYGVMEACAAQGQVLLVPGFFEWNDVGSWDMMRSLNRTDENGNVLVGDVLAIDAKNCICYSTKRTVAIAAVSNIVVVETADAILVCSSDKAQNVKQIVDVLGQQGRDELL